MAMIIIACLGNPGRKYSENRHNVGFIIGEYLAKRYSISVAKKMFSSISGKGRIEEEDALILFPQTFMNTSGVAVQSAIDYYRERPENLIVVHDEIELPFGEVRIKFGGGHKGHNGIRSIIQHIDTPDFYRIRIGVGRPVNSKMKVADYLLSDFSIEELKQIEEISPVIIEKIVQIITSSELEV